MVDGGWWMVGGGWWVFAVPFVCSLTGVCVERESVCVERVERESVCVEGGRKEGRKGGRDAPNIL